MSESRTSKSIKNAQVTLFFYLINLVLSFISRTVFMKHLGTELLGLNTIVSNLLGFLNLAELGIGVAVSYALYGSLYQKDTVTINEIVSIQGWLYRKIACLMLGGGCVIMCFFPLLFADGKFPLGYAYGAFIVMLVSNLSSYFMNYRQIVLSADQKGYKLTISIHSLRIVKVLLQIAAITFLSHGYIYWLILHLLLTFVTCIAINKVLKKEYPWLKPDPRMGRMLKSKYPQIIAKTKQLFVHKIGSVVLQNISPLVIYANASLTVVGIYGNYVLIINGITMLLSALFNSINAGIGNLVVESNNGRIWSVYRELFSVRFLCVATCCYLYLKLGPSFIKLWIGEQYIFDNIIFLLMAAIMYINLMRTIIDSFIGAYGLYRDVWSTITEAVLNVGISLLLGHWWGIKGVLTGVLISLIIIVFLWKPYFLFSRGFRIPFRRYCFYYLKHIVPGVVACMFSNIVIGKFFASAPETFFQWVFYALCLTLVFGGVLWALLLCICPEIRNFMKRLGFRR